MKNGSFVFDAHTGFWDASRENCKNRFGDVFIESFYGIHNALNPPPFRVPASRGPGSAAEP